MTNTSSRPIRLPFLTLLSHLLSLITKENHIYFACLSPPLNYLSSLYFFLKPCLDLDRNSKILLIHHANRQKMFLFFQPVLKYQRIP